MLQKVLFRCLNLCLPAVLLVSFYTVSFSGQDTTSVIKSTGKDTVSNVFELGRITVTGKKTTQSFDNVSSESMDRENKTDVADALRTLPGLTAVNVGPRNEANIYIRGFNSLQATMYLDGVPVYVPYDGNIDLARFTTFDVAEISVEKGAVSPLYGANTMGGVINIVTKKPSSLLDMSVKTGIKSGDGYLGALTAGTRLGHFYGTGTISILNQDNYELSDQFKTTKFQRSDKRGNSYEQDWKASAKIGWEDSTIGEFSLCYASQNGKKGTPVYAGSDSLSTAQARFWKWPYYNKNNLYAISKLNLGNFGYLKIPLYFDNFQNSLYAYDDINYTTQKERSSFRSWYDDFTLGGSVQLVSGIIPNDSFKIAVNYKNDYHKEGNTSNDTVKAAGKESFVNKPDISFRDYTVGLAIENSLKLLNRLTLVPSGSVNYRKSLTAQNLTEPKSFQYAVTDFPLESNIGWNLQLASFFNINNLNTINLSVSHRTRFPSIKDRYSYRLGTAIPNPDLNPEYAVQSELGYSGKPVNNLFIQFSVWDAELKDVIQMVSKVGSNGESQNQNKGKARFYGYELGTRYDVLEHIPGIECLSLSYNCSYTKRRNISDPTLLFIDIPELKSAFSINYSPFSWITFEWNNEWNGLRYATSDGKRKADAFSIENARMSLSWRSISLNGGINNLLDANYSLLEGYPEPGRNYFVNLSYALKSKGE
jgi:iron complex outermembrane receptor protein